MNAPTEGARILLAEDNVVNQKIACKILEKLGCTVLTAENGEEAIAKWQAGTFDLVLMDIQMPVLDGLEATRRLRQLEEGRDVRTPIVALTANVMNDDIARCKAAGMDSHLPKPFLIEDVKREIGFWMAKKAA